MWYVIWTTTGKEEQCCKVIQRVCAPGSFDRCVVAWKKIERKINGVWEMRTEMLAPSYVFVETRDVECFAKELSHVISFSELLKNEHQYMPLQERESYLLENLLKGGDIIEESFGIKEGTHITILKGSLKGLEGMIKYIDRHKKIAIIEMNLFDRLVSMKMGLELVTPEQMKIREESGAEEERKVAVS